MSFGIDRPQRRRLAMLALLLFWLFGQISLSAHEILIDHNLNNSCEWLCQITNHDDYIVGSINPASTEISVDVFTSVYVSLISPANRFLQPLYRGPPTESLI